MRKWSENIFQGNTHFCRIRDRGGAGRPPSLTKFLRTKLTPANYISLEREFNGDFEYVVTFVKYLNFAIL